MTKACNDCTHALCVHGACEHLSEEIMITPSELVVMERMIIEAKYGVVGLKRALQETMNVKVESELMHHDIWGTILLNTKALQTQLNDLVVKLEGQVH